MRPSAELRESGIEKGVNVMGLEAAQRGFVHVAPDAVHVGVADVVSREHRVCDGSGNPLGHVGVDDLFELAAHLGLIPVADCVGQQPSWLAA
ncbi:MAG: hypothetical protein OXD37_07790 [Acidimicrobiaceae bacterium]|nr:hypothetical protein [Acidimicrobiaceae bacterium]